VIASDSELVARALEIIADRVAERVVAQLRSGEAPGWIDQARSPLGPRRHRSAVQRRLGRGEPGASLVGRRHLLSPEAVNEELARITKTKRPTAAAQSVEQLATELGLSVVNGGRR
jgi:hypothetical protein